MGIEWSLNTEGSSERKSNMKTSKYLRYQYRKLRLIVRSFLFLPSYVRIVADGREARLATRGYPTANVALWLQTKDVVEYEPEETALLRPFLKKARVFWDIGAQIGYYSILACLSGVQKVVAVDIDKRYCQEIEKHASKNKLPITVLCAAIGSEGEEVFFENYARATKRRAIPLDLLAGKYGKPDVIKMDIDGGEFGAIMSGEKLLSSPDAPVLMIELDPGLSNVEKITGILHDHGYVLYAKHRVNTIWIKQK